MAAMEAKIELFETFRTQWQCFRCKAPPGPGTGKDRFLCSKNNHPLCVKCKDVRCPCGSKLDSSKKPCEFIGKTIEKFPWFHCYFYENGCREMLEEANYYSHTNNCIFRKVYCPYLTCRKYHSLINVADHVKIDHKIEIREIKANESWRAGYEYGKEYYYFHDFFPPREAKIQDGTIFYFVGYRQSETKVSAVWIYILGSKEEAKNYGCSISLTKSRQKLTFQGPVHSIDEDCRNVLKSAETFILTEGTLKRFLSSVDKKVRLEFQFSIQCLKEQEENVGSCVSGEKPDQGQDLSANDISNQLSSLLKVD